VRDLDRQREKLHLLEQGCRVIDTAAWPGGLDLDDHGMDLVLGRAEIFAAASLECEKSAQLLATFQA
jgi:hypothetical protein